VGEGTVPVSAGVRTVLSSLPLKLVVGLLGCGNKQLQAPARSRERKHSTDVNAEVQNIDTLLTSVHRTLMNNAEKECVFCGIMVWNKARLV